MIGITAVGAHVPVYRLDAGEVAKMWSARTYAGMKAVAGYDEDTITMAVSAALDCLKGNSGDVNGVYLATTTAPYLEKQSAAIVASALDLDGECHTADLTDSLRASTTALKAAIDAVKSGSAENVMVTASDRRLVAAKGPLEPILGDGAAAVMIGSKKVLASVEGSHSIFSDFTDLWRTEGDIFVRSAEGRFIDEVGYLPAMRDAINGLMKKYKLSAKDFSKAVFYAADNRQHAKLAGQLGLQEDQIQAPFFDRIGNTGAAAALMMLVAALEQAEPGDRILFASYGDGSDVFVFRATEEIRAIRRNPRMEDRLARKISINYGKYLAWRNLVTVEASTLPERPPISLPTRWRERRAIAALYGVKCKHCDTPQISPTGQAIRICVACQAKDGFEDYKFSDKKAKLFTYAADQLQPTQNPPGLNGVIDFEGGGRLICELTDYELEKITVGMPLEMTYRKMYHSRGINNYYWKARPLLNQ